jgi:hypothetical protein
MESNLRLVAAAVCLSAVAGLAAARAQTPPAQGATPQPTAAQGATATPAVEGEWRGALEVAGAGELRLVVKLKRLAGRLAGGLDSPDQGASDLPLSDVTFADRVLRFRMPNPQADGSYEGVMSADGPRIDGYWEQAGVRRPLRFARAGAAGSPQAAADAARRTAAPPATPQTFRRGRVELRACAKESLKNALCGRYEVFEDRAAKSGRRIALNVVVLPALSEKPAPDPIFYFAGGPGAAASMYADQPSMTRLRQNRDVVMISGDFDPVTPPFVGAALAQYAQGRQIVVRNGTHSSYPCTERLTAEFIERGTWQGLDTSCVDQVRRPPFFVPPPAAATPR